MAQFLWSEVFFFFSSEGESRYSGTPTIYARLVGCNFECQGFNNPDKVDTTTVEGIGFDPKQYKTLQEMPLITRGCDSIYSWDKKFAHTWQRGSADDLIDAIIDALPNKSFIYPTGLRAIWSITGGEPTLHAKKLPELFHHPRMIDCQHILIETNCATPLKHEFLMEINKWLCADKNRKWTWSNSPKLSASGEPWEKAIRPEIATAQRLAMGPEFTNQMDQYFKFVSDGTDESFEEVAKAMEEYYTAGIPRSAGVYIMPAGTQEDQQMQVARIVADKCNALGYIYCHRIHLSVWGGTVGT